MRHLTLGALCLNLSLAGCASQPSEVIRQECDTGRFLITGDYPGSRLGICEVLDENSIALYNAPEKSPNHHSPWYGFKVTQGSGQLQVLLNYSEKEHRYWPKYSEDGLIWHALPAADFAVAKDKKSITLELMLNATPLWISAQENLSGQWYEEWLESIKDRFPGLIQSNIGQSVAARDIPAIETNPAANDVLLLIGRQHPAEISGAIALRHFADWLLNGHPSICKTQSALCAFYQRTNIVIVPNLNPDGVHLGHWRYGLNGTDLNRDWRGFQQPEIAAMRKLIDRLVNDGKQITLFLDFHSTARNVFYIQPETLATDPENFATEWLAEAARHETYPFSSQPTGVEQANAKNYIYTRFGIPAITYEVGDETNRDLIASSAEVFAAAMVKTLNQAQGK